MARRLLLLVLLAACGREAAPPSPAVTPPPAPAETGRFLAQYEPATSPDLRELRGRLVASRLLDTVAAGLNDSVRIRENVVIAGSECGEPSAFYRPEARRVTLCYELLAELSSRFRSSPEADILVAGTTAFVLLHEVGHALIHVLDLPTTGREEDAVDQLATLLMLGEGAVGDSLAFAAAEWFLQSAQRTRITRLAFADEHGLDAQRVYSIICWVHGRDPSRYPEIVREGWLPAARAERCPAEYARVSRSWTRLLAPYHRSR
jgi:hypothetical protein